MTDKRPINLDLLTISLPVTAVVSILHRISGVFLFAGGPLLLWLLGMALDSEQSYARLLALLDTLWLRILLWWVLTALGYHLLAGIRHLFMDFGCGESLRAGRITAVCVLVGAGLTALMAAIWLW